MELLKKTLFFITITALVSVESASVDEGVSERSLPLILQQSAEFEKNKPANQVLEVKEENTDTDDLIFEVGDKRRILYLMSKGNVSKAIEHYLAYYEKEKKHDSKILQQIAQILLESGASSYDMETQLLTLCGIALSNQHSSLYFLERALNSQFPMVQSVALSLLGSAHDDECESIIASAMRSKYLLVRYEALHYLVARKSKNALGYIDSLINLLHPAARPLFVEFYATYGSKEAMQRLKQFLNDSDMNVRIAAIGSICSHNYDNLLPNIRSIFSQSDPCLKEACAKTLGDMRDLHSIESLKIAAESPFDDTKLASLYALHQLGDQSAKEKIADMAKRKNLYAIYMLSYIEGYDDLLARLSTNIDSTIRLNASLALLRKRNPKCLPVIKDIISSDIDFIGFVPFVSHGRTLVAWKPLSVSVIKHPDVKRNIQAITLSFIDEVLTSSLELAEDDFLDISRDILAKKGSHSVAILMHLLENIKSKKVFDLLKEKSQEVGSPLVRGYASLALYRMNGEESYRTSFLNWLKTQNGEQLIEFKPMMDRGARDDKVISNYQLSPQDRSALLIESFDTLATKHEIEGISLLLEAMKDGHPKNRYALAGLLLKSIH